MDLSGKLPLNLLKGMLTESQYLKFDLFRLLHFCNTRNVGIRSDKIGLKL